MAPMRLLLHRLSAIGYRASRRFARLSAIGYFLLAACGPTQPLPSPPPPVPTIAAVGEILAGPTVGPLRLVGYLYITPEGAALVDSLSFSAALPAPVEPGGIWLGDVPALPDAVPLVEAGSVRYAIVTAEGTLEGPGAFGPRGAYSYQLLEPRVEPLSVRDLSMRLLLDNSGLYAGQPVRLQGQLLANADGAVLVERLGPGGVPEASALQIKLAPTTHDRALLEQLSPAGNGDVRFGPVEVTGIWRSNRLYPLSIRVAMTR